MGRNVRTLGKNWRPLVAVGDSKDDEMFPEVLWFSHEAWKIFLANLPVRKTAV